MNIYNDRKEDLKSRMLRHIAVIWEMKNTDALDPLVRILIEAIAGELEKTHNEINNFEKRVLEKIAAMMTPGLLSSPYCAHAIAYAKPAEHIQVITPATHFFYSKKMPALDGKNLDLFFTPVDHIRLFDAHVSYLVAGNKIFYTDRNLQKSILTNAGNTPVNNNDIWLGINLNNDIEDINHLRFYFDIKNTEKKDLVQSLLQFAKWYINDKEVETVKGVVYENKAEEHKQREIFADYDVMHLMEKEVKQLYNNQFITLKDADKKISVKSIKTLYPAALETVFSAADLKEFTAEMLWVKLTASTFIDEKTLFDLFVTVNAFPVINRRLKRLSHRFKGLTNIIPIKTDVFEHFLFVKSLKDMKGKEYTQLPFAQANASETGTYSIRKGVERFDTRSAKEYLNYLVELLRDESAIFSSYGQDTIANLLKDIDRALAQIEQRIKQHAFYDTDAHHYIAMEGIENQSTVSLAYWVTNGAAANLIHANVPLMLYEGAEVKLNSIVLLNMTSGGKKSIDPSRHMEAYKYALLTHNRIVTAEDIKAFCMYELGDKIAQVDIVKGVMRSDNPKEGLVRCIDILLKKKKGMPENIAEEEWTLLFKEVKAKLELRSAINANYRLMLA